MYRFIRTSERDRCRLKGQESTHDSKTDKSSYQSFSSSGMKGVLNFLLCLLICIFTMNILF